MIKNGGTEEYEAVLNIYKTAELHEEKIRALRALGLAKDAALTKRTLVSTILIVSHKFMLSCLSGIRIVSRCEVAGCVLCHCIYRFFP